MAFPDYEIPAFDKTISMLDDEPALSPAELKAAFDAAPEQLRQSLNGVCAEADALDRRVTGITVGTFPDAIGEDMLSAALRQKLAAKAEQTALDNEAAARQTLATELLKRCELACGTFTGDGAVARTIPLGWQPRAVLVMTRGGFTDYNSGSRVYGGLAVGQSAVTTSSGDAALSISSTGFNVFNNSYSVLTNQSGQVYHYLALR